MAEPRAYALDPAFAEDVREVVARVLAGHHNPPPDRPTRPNHAPRNLQRVYVPDPAQTATVNNTVYYLGALAQWSVAAGAYVYPFGAGGRTGGLVAGTIPVPSVAVFFPDGRVPGTLSGWDCVGWGEVAAAFAQPGGTPLAAATYPTFAPFGNEPAGLTGFLRPVGLVNNALAYLSQPMTAVTFYFARLDDWSSGQILTGTGVTQQPPGSPLSGGFYDVAPPYIGVLFQKSNGPLTVDGANVYFAQRTGGRLTVAGGDGSVQTYDVWCTPERDCG